MCFTQENLLLVLIFWHTSFHWFSPYEHNTFLFVHEIVESLLSFSYVKQALLIGCLESLWTFYWLRVVLNISGWHSRTQAGVGREQCVQKRSTRSLHHQAVNKTYTNVTIFYMQLHQGSHVFAHVNVSANIIFLYKFINYKFIYKSFNLSIWGPEGDSVLGSFLLDLVPDF